MRLIKSPLFCVKMELALHVNIKLSEIERKRKSAPQLSFKRLLTRTQKRSLKRAGGDFVFRAQPYELPNLTGIEIPFLVLLVFTILTSSY